MTAVDGFVYGPTPLEAADHIEKWEAMKAAGVEGLPSYPVEMQTVSGRWTTSGMGANAWLDEANNINNEYRDEPRHPYRLVPLPVVPPVPVVVKVEDANDAQALIGRSIDGEEIEMAWTTATRFGFCDEDGDAIINRAWGGSVTVDPEPPPAPVEPDTVSAAEIEEAVEQLAAHLVNASRSMTMTATETALRVLRAALAAEGDRR